MTKKVRLFVLGTGGMAAAHCKAFNADPRVEIVGCADIELARAEKFTLENKAGKAFGSLDEAIKWGEFVAVTNVTPERNTSPPSKCEIITVSSGSGIEKGSPYISSFSISIIAGRPAAIG